MARKAKKVLSAEELQWAAEDAAAAARSEARRKYHEMLAKCEAAQAAYPRAHILDEAISRENASDGLFNNENIRMSGSEYDWGVLEFEYMARNLEADTGYRLAEIGADPAAFGIRF